MTDTKFVQLSTDWNAEPNAPEPLVVISDRDVVLELSPNPFAFTRFADRERIRIVFREAWRYRLGPTNDEGWYRGKCRFSKVAPGWGELYEVEGDLRLDQCPNDWHYVGGLDESSVTTTKHYLFYLRDETFECDAHSWDFLL